MVIRHNQKITSQYASLFSVILRQYVHLISRYAVKCDAKYTSHFVLVIYFHMPNISYNEFINICNIIALI
ncbi:MAG: hypothetical protein PWP67_2912 [Clostridium butyricum]|nr:hypothetical protein [Clostridium butyricum]